MGGKSYFEMSDSGGNHISTTAFEPVDDEARAQWEKGQERLQDLIDSPSGAMAYGAAYLAGASQEDQDRALELGKAAGQIVGVVAGVAGTARNVRWSSFGQSKPEVEAWVGKATSKSYRAAFLKARPELDGKVVVHHAIEQQVLKAFPGVFTQSEIHSLENLRGIPNALNPNLHLRIIRDEWDDFYRRFANSDTMPTKEQFLQKATEIDRKYGHRFAPQLGEGN